MLYTQCHYATYELHNFHQWKPKGTDSHILQLCLRSYHHLSKENPNTRLYLEQKKY